MRSKLLIALFLVGGMVAIAQAQPGGTIGAGSVTGLIVSKAVQEDLKMTDAQITKTMEWARDFRTKAMEIRKDKGVDFVGGKGAFTPPTPEQLEKIVAANAEIRKVSYKELGDVLKKEQIERLKQIDRQSMGIAAFTNDDVVAKTLNLTDTQKKSLKEIADDFGKARGEIMSGAFSGGFDVEKIQEVQKKIQKIHNEHIEKAVALLTDEQKTAWRKLKGETFDLQKLIPQFPKKKD